MNNFITQSLLSPMVKIFENRSTFAEVMGNKVPYRVFSTKHDAILSTFIEGSSTSLKEPEKMQKKLETKASPREGQCIPAGCRVTLPRKVFITMSIITTRSIGCFPQTLRPIVYVF